MVRVLWKKLKGRGLVAVAVRFQNPTTELSGLIRVCSRNWRYRIHCELKSGRGV